MRLIDANELKQRILAERDKIPFTLPGATYEFGIAKPNHHGNSMRGGIRKALRCMEQCKTMDSVEVVRCRDCKYYYDYGVNRDYCCHRSKCGKQVFDVKFKADDFCSYGERKSE